MFKNGSHHILPHGLQVSFKIYLSFPIPGADKESGETGSLWVSFLKREIFPCFFSKVS